LLASSSIFQPDAAIADAVNNIVERIKKERSVLVIIVLYLSPD